MTTAKIDVSKITKAAKESFKEACMIGHRSIIQVISEPGAFSSTPNDLIDTGLLRASQQPPGFSEGGTAATFRNTVDYGIYVYYGYTTRSGRSIEGRPWIAEGLKRANIPATTQKLLDSKL